MSNETLRGILLQQKRTLVDRSTAKIDVVNGLGMLQGYEMNGYQQR